MTPKQRLLLASLCFLAWIGYLGYLVSITREPVILSRPQFLVADLYVLAHLEEAPQPKKDFRLPEVGEGAQEAEVVRWRVKPGDAVKRNQVLLEVLADKVTVEVTASFAGTIDSLRAETGRPAKVGDVILTYLEAARPKPEVKILQVNWAEDEVLKNLVDSTIKIRNLAICESANGWIGPGDFILPLTKEDKGYSLTEIPPSPGFQAGIQNDGTHNELRIYHATSEASEQLRKLIAEFHE